MSKNVVGLVGAVFLFFRLAIAPVFAQDFSSLYRPGGNEPPVAVSRGAPASIEIPSQIPEQRQPVLRAILLHNDQIVVGEVFEEGKTLQIRNEIGIIRVQKQDVALIASNVSEIYHHKKNKIQSTSAEFLKLAYWCVANKLQDEASYEFDRAILWAENRQLADSLRTQKNIAMSTFENYSLQQELLEQEKQKYGQWKKQIPSDTFLTFKKEILPLLSKNCSGIACHGSNSLNEFRLLPNPHNNDVDVGKNLQAVLGYIVPDATDKSPLLLVPIVPHGRTKEIFTRQNIKPYEKLCDWVDQVAGEMSRYYPLDEDDRVASAGTLDNSDKRQTTSPSPQAGTPMQQGFDRNVSFPLPGETLIDQPDTEKTSSFMSQGFAVGTAPITTQGLTPKQNDFDVFSQSPIVLSGTSPGGWQQPARPEHLNRPKPVEVMTHNSTDAFEHGNVMQNLQREPIDPFDPVLFNRQYHLKRITNAAPE